MAQTGESKRSRLNYTSSSSSTIVSRSARMCSCLPSSKPTRRLPSAEAVASTAPKNHKGLRSISKVARTRRPTSSVGLSRRLRRGGAAPSSSSASCAPHLCQSRGRLDLCSGTAAAAAAAAPHSCSSTSTAAS
eukprot:scaffold4412_cov71-Phaeocystis_antarctica.AAC.8